MNQVSQFPLIWERDVKGPKRIFPRCHYNNARGEKDLDTDFICNEGNN
jgi:hypothetical protein